MIALVIITTDDHDSRHKMIWQQITTNKDKILNKFEASVISDLTATIYIDTEHVFLCIKEQGNAHITEKNTNTAINDISQTLSEAYICYHSTDPRLQIIPDQIGTSIRMKYAEKFKHGDENLYPKIESIVSGIVNLDEATTSNFEELFEFIKKKSNENLEAYLLHLFLPLDIDMQALGKIEKSERYKYLQRMRVDNIDYLHRFRNLKTRVEGLGENGAIDKARLHEIVGITNDNVSQFFEKLQNKVMIPDDLLAHVWGIEGIQTFPDWYCALVACLKSNEAELESRI